VTVFLGKTTTGGLVDGPISKAIHDNLRGLTLLRPDPYAAFQGGRTVYHDDIGDYSTNEPTLDGTASLSYYLSTLEKEGRAERAASASDVYDAHGAISGRSMRRASTWSSLPMSTVRDLSTSSMYWMTRISRGHFSLPGIF
jgi:hypothetical protein